MITENLICHYSDLPSLLAYQFLVDEDEAPQLTAPAISSHDVKRIIEVALCDKSPFDSIKSQFGLNESEVISLMKARLKFKNYRLWRKRVEGCSAKHIKTRAEGISRFKSTMQRIINFNKISKRK